MLIRAFSYCVCVPIEMEIHVVDAENVMDMEFPKYGQSIGKWQGNSIKLPAGTVKDLETDGT